MKKLTLTIVTEDEEDLLPMVQMMMMQFTYLERTTAKMVTHSGYIQWKVEDSKYIDMTNFTLLEEKSE